MVDLDGNNAIDYQEFKALMESTMDSTEGGEGSYPPVASAAAASAAAAEPEPTAAAEVDGRMAELGMADAEAGDVTGRLV